MPGASVPDLAGQDASLADEEVEHVHQVALLVGPATKTTLVNFVRTRNVAPKVRCV